VAVTTGILIRATILLVGAGIVWAWLWLGLHFVPGGIFVLPVLDIAVYGLVGYVLSRELAKYAVGGRRRLVLGAAAIGLFYIGNRLIGLTSIFGLEALTRFTEPDHWVGLFLLESLTLLVGFWATWFGPRYRD
jgi:hypothetical protein